MSKTKIGIVLGSTRNGRVSPRVGKWLLEQTAKMHQFEFELVDLADYNLPFLGTSQDISEVVKWNNTLKRLDGFIFVTAEYNHSIPAVLKNALDSAKDNWFDKTAAIVSYGSAGGARAAEHLKAILTELHIAVVRTQVLFSLFDDFKDGEFTPRELHQANLNDMLQQLISWSNAMNLVRKNK